MEELRLTKQKLGWPEQPSFYIPEAAAAHFLEGGQPGRQAEAAWQEKFSTYQQQFPQLALELQQLMEGGKAGLPPGWDADIPQFPADAKGMATRVASGKVMNAIAAHLPALIGGSADLDPSTYSALKGFGDFEPGDIIAGDPRVPTAAAGLQRPQPAFRRARTCDGRDHQRHGSARRRVAVRRHLPVFRPHAALYPPCRPDGLAGGACS